MRPSRRRVADLRACLSADVGKVNRLRWRAGVFHCCSRDQGPLFTGVNEGGPSSNWKRAEAAGSEKVR